LDKLGPSQNDEFVEFLLSTAGQHQEMKEEGLFVKKEENIELEIEAYEPPISKKARVEKDMVSKMDICSLLGESADLEKVWENLNSDEMSDIIVNNELNPEEGLDNLMRSLVVKKLENNLALEYFQSLMIQFILLMKTHQKSYETFFETYIALYPASCFDISYKLVDDNNMASLVIFITNMDLLNEEQEKMILCKWLSMFSIKSDTLELPEVILNRNSKLYQDKDVVVALANSFSAGGEENSDKCSKFSKFLLQVLSMIDPSVIDEKSIRNLRSVIERNKTFLKKRLELELNKKVCH